MLGNDKIIDLLNTFVQEAKKKGAGQAEALYLGRHSDTARFANSSVIQSIRESDRTIYFRVFLDKKVGVTSTNSLHSDDLKRCLDKAINIARHSIPRKFVDTLPKSSVYPKVMTYCEETANLSAYEKIRLLSGIFKMAEKEGLKAGGAFTTEASEIGIANSNRLSAYQSFTQANAALITSSPTGSGFASEFTQNAKDIHAHRLFNIAAKKVLWKTRPKKLKPGRYTVILEPAAVSEILEWLVYIGFGAMNFMDGTSFMSGRLGKKVMDKKVTIYDDGLDPEGFPVPFDFEGVRKKRLNLIEQGVAKGIVYDTLFAKRYKKKTTGHALLPDDVEGPFPSNIFMKQGDDSLEKIISEVEQGILITRFHYVNGLLDTKKGTMTGMTRDGTFYIEEGEVRYPVEDMRFTESILEAFSRIEAVSSERQAFPVPWNVIGACVVPALVIREFNFSG